MKNGLNHDRYLQQLTEQMTKINWLDGLPAQLIHLSNDNGMSVSFMDIGATWLSARVPVKDEWREVVLRAKNMSAHLEQTAYLGAVVGRFGNRIAQGRFELNGHQYQLPVNNGENSLHGGEVGFDKRRWQVKSQTQQSVTFALFSPDGEQGYPGNMHIEVCYQLTNANQLDIEYWATTDQDCPVNLTNHAYFNLAGEGAKAAAKDHRLQTCATHYLPTDHSMIPTGEVKATSGTSFDFSQSKLIGQDFLSDQDQKIAGGYDHAMIFDTVCCDGSQWVAQLTAPQEDIVLQVATTQPAMQLYTGNYLAGIDGVSQRYPNYHGVALETQGLPDGPNHPEWLALNLGHPILKAGQTYQHKTAYRFVS